jgi:hypothetical protein
MANLSERQRRFNDRGEKPFPQGQIGSSHIFTVVCAILPDAQNPDAS